MRSKLLISIVLIALVVGVAFAWRSTVLNFQSPDAGTIKVVIDQLPVKDGVIPIEILQPIILTGASNELEEFTFIVRNNSARAINALAVIETIVYEEGSQRHATSSYLMMDYAFHPDMARPKLFEPGTDAQMESGGSVSFDGVVVIKEVTLKVDYASYDDDTAFGRGREGMRRINAMRAGAREYKKWLEQQYSQNGKSLTAIVPLLQSSDVFKELKLDLNQVLGADRYRLYLIQTLQTKGAADVESYFKQNPPKPNQK